MFNNPLRIVSPGRGKEAGREATKGRFEGWFARKRDTLEYFFNGEPRNKDLQPREERDSLERSGTGSGGTWQKPNLERKSHRSNANESSSYADSSSLCLSLSHAYVPIVCMVSKKKRKKKEREAANRQIEGCFFWRQVERGEERKREREREWESELSRGTLLSASSKHRSRLFLSLRLQLEIFRRTPGQTVSRVSETFSKRNKGPTPSKHLSLVLCGLSFPFYVDYFSSVSLIWRGFGKTVPDEVFLELCKLFVANVRTMLKYIRSLYVIIDYISGNYFWIVYIFSTICNFYLNEWWSVLNFRELFFLCFVHMEEFR